ncbi:hypothetical protein GCK72_021003 [Caenorhabditis remanei]|uniref:G-protein coupled receptors family 1 profile domain-containing protein n=1 Tax=Caenorhabditis remanei TaxID=31234 RepID=A0A6A5GIL9_CAERE|nr:hypothetical protein GCK72_021003 [Caenorhabditis remanei]KAF1754441.1 hypothetical protein GCK72_021003 [Caenorhabditis remanei]
MNNTTNPLDIEYLVKYPNLMISIFGFVTNLIHLWFVSRDIRTQPVFLFLTVICVSDLFQLSVTIVNKTVSVINYIEHKNCVGYFSIPDLIYKLTSEAFFTAPEHISSWIIVVMAYMQVGYLRKKKVVTYKNVTVASMVTVLLNIVYHIMLLTSLALIISRTPWTECTPVVVFTEYLTSNSNFFTKFYTNLRDFDGLLVIIRLLTTIFFPSYLLILSWKTADIQAKKTSKLIISVTLSFISVDILIVITRLWLMEFDENGVSTK